MAVDNSFELGATRLSAVCTPLPPVLLPKPMTSVDRTLQAWDGDIQRAAAATAARLPDHRVDADDLVQAARIRLWRALSADPTLAEHFIRKVVANAMRSEARRARKGVRLAEDSLAREVAAPSMSSGELDREEAARNWVATLPVRERALYQSIYVEGLTQREAAHRLHVSQPRIAQLHRRLLRAGRVELAGIAA